jgi:TPR repeat protein
MTAGGNPRAIIKMDDDDEKVESAAVEASEAPESVAFELYTVEGKETFDDEDIRLFFSTAIPTLTELSERGDARAQFSLGYIYFTGDGVEKDEEMGIGYMRRAADQGDSDALSFLADCTRKNG